MTAVGIFQGIYGYSRTCIIITLGLVVFLILKKFSCMTGKKKILSIVGLMVLIPLSLCIFDNYYKSNISTNTPSNVERTMLINAAIFDFKKHPIFGVGLGNFSSFAIDYGGYPIRNRTFPAHNVYIELLAECGIVGLSLFLLVLVDLFGIIANKKSNIADGLLFVYFVAFYMFNTYSGTNRILLSFILAILYNSKKNVNDISDKK